MDGQGRLNIHCETTGQERVKKSYLISVINGKNNILILIPGGVDSLGVKGKVQFMKHESV